MNKVSSLAVSRTGAAASLVGMALMAMAVVYSPSALAYDLDDEMLAMEGEFQLSNGDTKLIADHRKAEPYRVCVAKSQNSVPVLARYDGQELKINVGDCSDMTAKLITLSPAEKLAPDTVLIGKYRHIKK